MSEVTTSSSALKTPRVTVLMSVYNGARHLDTAIDSVLAQTFADFELLIIDDASTDETPTILARRASEDARIVVHRNDANLGLTKSLNLGLRMARGELIARHDADDLSDPTRFEKQVRYLDANPSCVLVTGEVESIDDSGTPTPERTRACPDDMVEWRLMFRNGLSGHGLVMFRRDAALTEGGYDEAYSCSQDYEFWTRLIRRGSFHMLPEPLLKWRKTRGAISDGRHNEQRRLALTVTRRTLSALWSREATDDEVAMLSHFWTGYYDELSAAPTINAALRQSVEAYVSKRATDAARLRDMRRRLSREIAERWFDCVSMRFHPLLKLRVSCYAFRWNAPTMLRLCAREAARMAGLR